MLSKKQSGFTLIELMIAMAIIAILTTAGLSAYTGYLKTGRDSVRGTLASQVNTEVMNYAGGHGGKPPASPEEFRQFIQSAGASFGRSAAEISNDTIIQDPLGGKEVCLDANGNANQPCAFHYTAYADGTYAISYGVEDPSSMKTNFYKTTASIPDPVTHTTPVTKYGVYIGTAPYIGGPITTPQNNAAVDLPGVVTISFMSPRIDIVTVSGGGGGNIYGGGIACGVTICGVGQGCVGDVCVDPCGDAEIFCEEGEMCENSMCENTDPCAGTPNPGTVCSDGTVYVTTTLRTTQNDAGQYSWQVCPTSGGVNGFGCLNASLQWVGPVPLAPLTLATNETDGRVNITTLMERDGDLSDYPAAQVCDNSTANGNGDWYLPAKDELFELWLYSNIGFGGGSITNFNTSGWPAAYYWTSTEYNSTPAYYQHFQAPSGPQGFTSKNITLSVRCVRRL